MTRQTFISATYATRSQAIRAEVISDLVWNNRKVTGVRGNGPVTDTAIFRIKKNDAKKPDNWKFGV